MAKKFLVNIDLGGNQLLNALAHPASSAPTAYGKGQLWFDSTNNQLNVYNGTSFVPLTTGGTAVTSLNSFTGGVNIYGTTNQVTVTNSSGSITLSLPSTISVTTACATNFYGAFNGNATSATNSTTTSQTNFSALTISGSNVATQAYVNSSAWNNTSASVNYATNAGNAATTSQTAFTTLSTTGDVSVGGNLYISGSTTTISGSTTVISDPLLYIATGNPANVNDIGFIGHFTAGVYQHTGLFRQASTGIWQLVSGVIPEPGATVDISSAVYDPIRTGGLQISSGSTVTTASITSAGVGNFAGLSISGASVATQSYVTSQGYVTTSSSPNFTAASVGGVAVARKFVATATGNGALTSFTASHNFGTNDVNVRVYQTSAGPDTQYADVEVDVVRTSASVVTVSFATAPSNTTTYNIVVVG